MKIMKKGANCTFVMCIVSRGGEKERRERGGGPSLDESQDAKTESIICPPWSSALDYRVSLNQ